MLQVVCVVPMAFAFFCWTITPESPRWLLTKKRVSQADRILREIAKTNGAEPPEDLTPRLIKIANDTSEVVYGMGSLFVSWRLAWRSVLVSICFTASAFVYYQLVINIGNMGGNLGGDSIALIFPVHFSVHFSVHFWKLLTEVPPRKTSSYICL